MTEAVELMEMMNEFRSHESNMRTREELHRERKCRELYSSFTIRIRHL